jgi:hypothetical protein
LIDLELYWSIIQLVNPVSLRGSGNRPAKEEWEVLMHLFPEGMLALAKASLL